MSLPPPRVPICLKTTTRRLASQVGFELLTLPDRSVPSAWIVTVDDTVGAAVAVAPVPMARPAAEARPRNETAAVRVMRFMGLLLGLDATCRSRLLGCGCTPEPSQFPERANFFSGYPKTSTCTWSRCSSTTREPELSGGS